MGRASSSKKVQRAARAAGRPGTGRNWLWPAAIVVLVALGVTLVVISRGTDEASAEPPTFGDHWHAGYGVYTCDGFADPLTDQNGDANGVHTHEDGLIHIHPSSAQATGDKATLSVFFEEVGLSVEDDRLELPGGKTYAEGDDTCGDKPGVVQLAVWDSPTDEEPTIVSEDIASQKMADTALYTVAFAPEGADIPKPPSAATVASPSDVPGATPSVPVPPVPAPGDTSSTTAPAGEGSTTTAPAGDSTTSSSTP